MLKAFDPEGQWPDKTKKHYQRFAREVLEHDRVDEGRLVVLSPKALSKREIRQWFFDGETVVIGFRHIIMQFREEDADGGRSGSTFVTLDYAALRANVVALQRIARVIAGRQVPRQLMEVIETAFGDRLGRAAVPEELVAAIEAMGPMLADSPTGVMTLSEYHGLENKEAWDRVAVQQVPVDAMVGEVGRRVKTGARSLVKNLGRFLDGKERR